MEKIFAEHAQLEDMWLELYWEFKKRNNLSPDQILQKAGSIRGVLRPQTMQENINLLKQTGFDKVEPFFKWYNWAGFVAIKNQSSSGYQPAPGPNRNPSSNGPAEENRPNTENGSVEETGEEQSA